VLPACSALVIKKYRHFHTGNVHHRI